MAQTVSNDALPIVAGHGAETKAGKANKRKHRRILFRTVSMAWIITIFTVAIFISAVLPYQRRQLVTEMCQRALVVYTSTAQVAVESIVMDDFSAVVDHCLSIITQNPSVLYIVITRKDGFSLIHNQGTWRQETLKGFWQPADEKLLGQGVFMENPLGEGELFHLSYAFDYLGVDWGWIHLGLSTDKYREDAQTLYLQIGMIAAVAISAGFLFSLFFARRLSIPILNLERFARRIASGDLSRRIDIRTGDEVEKLAQSFNFMVDALQQAKREGKIAQQKLVETARQAGMAEMVSNVLHNAGNVLNSVGVTTSSMHQRINKSKTDSLVSLAAMVREQGESVADFIANDPRGRKVPAFLTSLADHLAKEKADLLSEMETLERHVQHVRDIIHLQQDYSRTRGVTEPVHIQQVIEDAMELIAEKNAKYGIVVQKVFDPLPECWMDRHKLLQILINLISNARDALMSEQSGPKIIRITLNHHQPERVRIMVSDNGAGISAENLTRIFQHGFTTRAEGHGFGLHSSAIAAGELNGTLKAESKGIGHGATFVVDLPFRAKENSNGPE